MKKNIENDSSALFVALILWAVFIVGYSFPLVDAFSGSGTGTQNDPYIITNCTQVQEMKDAWRANYSLNNNIDCSDSVNWNSGSGFLPIGNSSTTFTGIFNGQGNNITGLFINRSGTSYVGLFGRTLNATIINVGVTGTVNGSTYTGILAGYLTASKVNNSYSAGRVQVLTNFVGGLVGQTYNTNITESYSTANVVSLSTGSEGYAGGLVGYLAGTGRGSYVINSYAAGNVTARMRIGGLVGETSTGVIMYSHTENVIVNGTYQSIGGLVGYHGSSALIQNSYSTGRVYAYGSFDGGGLVGTAYGYIRDSYSTANVTCASCTVGGLVASIGIGLAGMINNSYSVGNLTSSSGGGIVGSGGSASYCKNLFWNNQTGKSSSSCGVGRTSAQLQNVSTFTLLSNISLNESWDFVGNPYNDTRSANHWNISSEINNGYPYLMGFTTADTSSPTITLNSPASSYTNDTSNPFSITFNCSVTDDVAVSNVSLYLTNPSNLSFASNQTTTTSGGSANVNWTVPLWTGNYTWNCLAYDSSNNLAFASSNRSILLNFSDSDGDNVSDSRDTLQGNISSPVVSGIDLFNITVNGSDSLTTYSGVHTVVMYDGESPIVNFTFNFSAATFYLENVRMVKDDNSLIVNLSGQLQADHNKTMYVDDNEFDSLCVKDQEISVISDMGDDCTGTNETDFDSCIGSDDRITIGNLSCTDMGSRFRIEGLRFSAVEGTPASEASTEDDSENDGGSSYIQELSSKNNNLRFYLSIPAGVLARKEISYPRGTGLKEFELKTKNWLTGKITIKDYDIKPEHCNIQGVEDSIFYKALEFDHSFDNEVIEQARIRVGIDKEWIEEKGISKIEVVRCPPSYEILRSSYVDETSHEGIYDVYSTGFSTYAFFGIPGQRSQADVELAPSLPEQSMFPWWIIVALTAILCLGIIFFRKHAFDFDEDMRLRNRWFNFEWKIKLHFNRRPPHKRMLGP